MEDPVSLAFRKVLEEIYWTETIEEAEKRLEKYLKNLDEDLRAFLLEKRRSFCNDPESLLRIVKLDALAEAMDDESSRKALLLRSMIETLFMAQCTEKWSNMGPGEKAKILAPLYRASYGLEIAMKQWPGRIDTFHLDNAENNLEIAYRRARETNILQELHDFMEEKANELVREEDYYPEN